MSEPVEYWAFTPTGCAPVDAVLAAIAQARRCYRNTEYWEDRDEEQGGTTAVARIQTAADAAARAVPRGATVVLPAVADPPAPWVVAFQERVVAAKFCQIADGSTMVLVREIVAGTAQASYREGWRDCLSALRTSVGT